MQIFKRSSPQLAQPIGRPREGKSPHGRRAVYEMGRCQGGQGRSNHELQRKSLIARLPMGKVAAFRYEAGRSSHIAHRTLWDRRLLGKSQLASTHTLRKASPQRIWYLKESFKADVSRRFCMD